MKTTVAVVEREREREREREERGVLEVVATSSHVIIRQTEPGFLSPAWERVLCRKRSFWKMQSSIIYLYPI